MNNKYNNTRRLGGDKYRRPAITATDKLTNEQIEKLLDDYIEEDITKIPLNSHVRYYTNVNDQQKFRYGGMLSYNKGLPKYVTLRNGSRSWSVQVENTKFFRKLTISEIKQEYEEDIKDLEKSNKKLKKKIVLLKQIIHNLKNGVTK